MPPVSGVPAVCRWRTGCNLRLVARTRGIATGELAVGESFHGGRGLCMVHHWRARQDGVLDDYERFTLPAVEIVRRWQPLAERGHTMASAARELGLQRWTVRRALIRAAAAPPARRPPGRRPFDPCTLDEGE